MSQASQVAADAAGVDWKVVATAAATFVGMLITTVWGWVQGKKKVEQTIAPVASSGAPQSAILMETVPLKENTTAVKEVRDQLFLNHHVSTNLCKAIEDNTSSMDDILTELKALRKFLEARGLT